MGYIFCSMRYYYEFYGCNHPTKYLYRCDHPLYSTCSLIKRGEKGLAVVQKKFNSNLKIYQYGPIDSRLMDDIVRQERFIQYFDEHSGIDNSGIFPTVEIRSIMWSLRMKPLEKAWWESQDLLGL